MHPAIPIAAEIIKEHTAAVVQLLEHRADLNYGLQLAQILQQVITRANTITEKQIESVLVLTRQTHDDFSDNLKHYMEQHAHFTRQRFATTDPRAWADIKAQLDNLDDRMTAIRQDMAELHHFSSSLIASCGAAGLAFTRDLSIPYHAELKQMR